MMFLLVLFKSYNTPHQLQPVAVSSSCDLHGCRAIGDWGLVLACCDGNTMPTRLITSISAPWQKLYMLLQSSTAGKFRTQWKAAASTAGVCQQGCRLASFKMVCVALRHGTLQGLPLGHDAPAPQKVTGLTKMHRSSEGPNTRMISPSLL